MVTVIEHIKKEFKAVFIEEPEDMGDINENRFDKIMKSTNLKEPTLYEVCFRTRRGVR